MTFHTSLKLFKIVSTYMDADEHIACKVNASLKLNKRTNVNDELYI